MEGLFVVIKTRKTATPKIFDYKVIMVLDWQVYVCLMLFVNIEQQQQHNRQLLLCCWLLLVVVVVIVVVGISPKPFKH